MKVDKSVQKAAWNEIVSSARVWQYDRYIAATLAPRDTRDDLIVIAAFAGDVDRILATVSEPSIAAIRLQWWRDVISPDTATTTGNPLADLLRSTMQRHRLPQQRFLDYLDAQEIELYSDLLPDLVVLKNHFVQRDGTLFDLATRVLVHPTVEMQAVIASGAQAYGLARTVAQLPLRFNERQFLIPADIAQRYAVAPGEGVAPEQVNLIGKELSQSAYADFASYRQNFQNVPRTARAALLPVALTGMYLALAGRHLDAAKAFDVEPSRFARAWRMLRAHWRGTT